MLINFTFENFFSFREGGEIHFANPSKIANKNGVSNIIGIKGANASGKTNALRAISFLSHFACDSFSYKPDDQIPIESFYGSKSPTNLSATIKFKEIEYIYELSLTEDKVKREVIYKRVKRKTKIIERDNEKIIFASKEMSEASSIRLRSNASLISTGHQYEIPYISFIWGLFRKIISNVSYEGIDPNPISEEDAAKFYFTHPGIFQKVKEFISGCDTGITDIKIIEEFNKKKNKNEYFPVYIHGEENGVLPLTESSGTRYLFSTLGRYFISLEFGATIVMDEIDRHLHPNIIPKILELYESKEINKIDAQLLFTTHNNEVIDILGRYRTYLVNKVENESFMYRLDEIPGDILRNDRSIYKAYREMKIGGVPKI